MIPLVRVLAGPFCLHERTASTNAPTMAGKAIFWWRGRERGMGWRQGERWMRSFLLRNTDSLQVGLMAW